MHHPKTTLCGQGLNQIFAGQKTISHTQAAAIQLTLKEGRGIKYLKNIYEPKYSRKSDSEGEMISNQDNRVWLQQSLQFIHFTL